MATPGTGYTLSLKARTVGGDAFDETRREPPMLP